MKKVEQINKDGNIVFDFDKKLSVKEIDSLFNKLFENECVKKGKQYVLFNKIGILACNVTYLGHPHPLYKKRIQLKSYYPKVLEDNVRFGLKTLYVGLYSYKTTRLFVVYNPSTYVAKKSHNSSAHIYSFNLQYAQRSGTFYKQDSFGNKIYVFQTFEFIRFIKNCAGEYIESDYEKIVEEIKSYIASFSKCIKPNWQGVNCYKEMIKAGDSNAKQSEWPGWYFEFLFKSYLIRNKSNMIEWHSNKKENEVDLDLKISISDWSYGDLKADQIGNDILGNSLECLDKVLREHNGSVYYICCLYHAEKDSLHGYEVTKFWDDLRGGEYRKNNYIDMATRYGKKMKYSVCPKIISVLKIDALSYELLRKNPFAQGKNSDGKARKPKLKIGKDMISALTICSYQII